MKQIIDLKEVKRLRNIVTGKETRPSKLAIKLERIRTFGIVPKEEEKKNRTFLFYYTLYTLVKSGTASTLLAKDVTSTLESNPDTEIHVCYLVNGPGTVPPELEGKKVIKHEVTSHENLSDYIYLIAGVKIDEAKLRATQKAIQKMVAMVTGKPSAETQRIAECLKINDAKQRKACLNGECLDGICYSSKK